MAAAISLDRHKFQRAKRKPCNSHQTYFSFPSPSPLQNAHAYAEKYGWLARLLGILTKPSASRFDKCLLPKEAFLLVVFDDFVLNKVFITVVDSLMNS